MKSVCLSLAAMLTAAPCLAQVPLTQLPPGNTDASQSASAVAPHLAMNALLAAASTASYPSGVWRDHYALGRKDPPLFFLPQTGTCAANNLADDGGYCVDTTGGNSWKAQASQINLLNFGAVDDGKTDSTTFYNNFLSACQKSPHRDCFIPAAGGIYDFRSQPNCITTGVHLHGSGAGDPSSLYKDYPDDEGDKRGLICLSGRSSGTSIEGLIVSSTANSRHGSLVSIIADANTSIGQIALRDLRLTIAGRADCATDYSLYVDGTRASVAPIGVRAPFFENIQSFGAAIASVAIKGVEGGHWAGGGIYGAGCSALTSGLIIGGTEAVLGQQSTFDIPVLDGGVRFVGDTRNNVIRTNYLGTTVGVSVQDTASDTGNLVYSPNVTGRVQDNWPATNFVGLPLQFSRNSNGLSSVAQPLPLLGAWKNRDGSSLAASASPGKFGYAISLGSSSRLLSEAARGSTKIDDAIYEWVLPSWYVAGTNITVTVNIFAVSGTGTVGRHTVEVKAYRVADTGAQGGNLGSGPQPFATGGGDVSFTISGTTLSPGDPLVLELETALQEIGGADPVTLSIGSVRPL